MCLLLSARIVKTEGELEISNTDEFDNSVRSIIGDGLSLAENEASESQSGFNHSDQSEQENRISSTTPPLNTPRTIPPHFFILTPPMAPPKVDQPVAELRENKSSNTSEKFESTRLVSSTSSSTPHSTSTLSSTTDGRRLFNFFGGFVPPFAAGNVNTVAPTTSMSASTPSVQVNATNTTTINQSSDETTFRPNGANSTNLWTEPASDKGNHTTDGRGIITSRTKTGFTVDDTLRCGYPPICDPQRCRVLNISSGRLESCEVPGAKGGFIFMIVLLALIIIVGNSLLPIIVWRNRDMRAPHNFMKGKSERLRDHLITSSF